LARAAERAPRESGSLTTEVPNEVHPGGRMGHAPRFFFMSLSPERGWEHALALHAATERALAPLAGKMEIVTTAEDLRRAAWRGVVGVLIGLENGRPLTLPGTLDSCSKLGIRYVTLTHNATHEWCDSATDAPAH